MRRRTIAGEGLRVPSPLIHDLEAEGLLLFWQRLKKTCRPDEPMSALVFTLLKRGRRSIFARLACDWGNGSSGLLRAQGVMARHWLGERPTSFLKARLNAASDS